MQNYHEPFVGGGSVLLGVLDSDILRVHGTLYASDLNPYLIHFYKTLQAQPDALLEAVCRTPASTEEEYYTLRDLFNTTRSGLTLDTAAQFLVLNRTCFRGVYREGPRGFNVPYGHPKKPWVVDADELRAISAKLARVVFTAQPYEAALARVAPGDFVYLDPPYLGTYTGYTSGGFPDYPAFFARVRELPSFVLSHSDHPQVRAAFPGDITESVTVRRAIHSKNPGTQAQEVLITRQ